MNAFFQSFQCGTEKYWYCAVEVLTDSKGKQLPASTGASWPVPGPGEKHRKPVPGPQGQYWGQQRKIESQYRGLLAVPGPEEKHRKPVMGQQGQYRGHWASARALKRQHRRAGTGELSPILGRVGCAVANLFQPSSKWYEITAVNSKCWGNKRIKLASKFKTDIIKTAEKLLNSIVLRPWWREIKYAPVTPFCSGNQKVQSILPAERVKCSWLALCPELWGQRILNQKWWIQW